MSLSPTEQSPLNSSASLDVANGEARELTSGRLGRVFAPVEAELQRCRHLFAEMLDEHEDERDLLISQVSPPRHRLGVKADIPVPLVTDMASQLCRMEGKWIRAGLVLLSGKVFRDPQEEAIQVASALELIHLATLVHDDIIDGGETRRGCPSLPRTHGDAASVLMGDLLYAKAMRLLVRTEQMAVLRSVIASVEQVCLGEISEHQFSWDCPPTEADYLRIIRRKTASLMDCCARTGCLLSGQEGEWVDRFGNFGLNLGMAFQITDDVLDITADGGSLGKDPGADIRNGNITLPIIHLAARHRDIPLQTLLTPGDASGPHLLRMLEEAGSLEYARAAAKGFAAQAEQSLTPIMKTMPDSKELESLAALAQLVVDRGY